MITSTDTLQSRLYGRVLVLTLNNPPANFLTSAMMSALNRVLDEIAASQDIGSVILTGTQGVFLTHFDVDEIDQAVASVPFTMSPQVVKAMTRTEALMDRVPGARRLLSHTPMAGVSDMNLFHEVTAKMRGMDKVFIAAINGRAMGGGCELALACDFRVMIEGSAEDGVMIGQPEILIGLIPGGGGTQALTRSLGVAKALEHCLEGRPITPAEALAMGMVNKVVPVESLMDEAMALAERMARRSPFAVQAIKQAVYQAASMSWNEGMEFEKNAFLSSASQANTRRAMGSYTAHVRTVLAEGRPMTVVDFQDLIDGTAVDMTAPG
ncbi:MAG: enoyl-CoA hydratase/isomerase family protein [Fluviicoccus sp.]|uniref:enoyl-CoA hydratase/isomerase family protein n=1 Tax=Fluviicoccus sp. TaxID=2003552 RepID=UPI00272307EE|nr:enoyl-CoA hydratase/isomerase family protein [Fluviicoccus sp.]MDO8330941.1 enoyl-CoA hydratase/isomerase family protein [Fluviicoccus sp.]